MKKFSKLIKIETLYLFRDIVFISRHCIYFETLYLIRDIVLFRDIVVISVKEHLLHINRAEPALRYTAIGSQQFTYM